MISACCGGLPPMNATCDEECASRPSLPAFVFYPTPLARAKSGQAMEALGGVPHAQRPPPAGRQARSKRTEGRWAPTQRARRFMDIFILYTPWMTSTARRPPRQPRATPTSNTSLAAIPAGPRPPRISPWAPSRSSSIPRPPTVLTATRPVANRAHVFPSPAWPTWTTKRWRNPC